jgi:hypothetical protein
MKKVIVSLFFVMALVILLVGRSGGPAEFLNQGYTNAPGEFNCLQCHTNGVYGTPTPLIQIFQQGTTTPVTAYTPGTTYDMRVTVFNNLGGTPPRFGFQMTALRSVGNQPLGVYSNLGTNVQQITANGRTYVEHNASSTNNLFTFRWTAPAAGTGNVDFYASGVCANNNLSMSGDNAGSFTLMISEAVPFSVSGVGINTTCYGLNNGAINITATGGAGGYTYSWSDGSNLEDRNGLAPGPYTVTVTDAASSTASASFTILQPDSISINTTFSPILCFGGSTQVTVSATGGTGTLSGTGTFTASAGTSSYMVTDQNGCSKTKTIQIVQPQQLTMNIITNGIIPCVGIGAAVTVNASGGTGALTGTGNFFISAPGTQTFTVTDANGCQVQQSANFTNASGLSMTSVLTQPTCTDTCSGIFIPTVSSNGTFTDSLVNNGTGETVNGFSSLCPGNYTYHVVDNNGCELTFPFSIFSPQPPTASVEAINPSNGGNNGSIDISVSGGIAPYTFEWSDGSDAEDLSGAPAGTYSVTVTDSNACSTVLENLVIWDVFEVAENSAFELSLYPNPFKQHFRLANAAHVVINIQDMQGRNLPFVQEGEDVIVNADFQGMGFVTVQTPQGTKTLKMIME